MADNRVTVNHIFMGLDTIQGKHPQVCIILAGDFNQLKDTQFKGTYNLKQIVKKATGNKLC